MSHKYITNVLKTAVILSILSVSQLEAGTACMRTYQTLITKSLSLLQEYAKYADSTSINYYRNAWISNMRTSTDSNTCTANANGLSRWSYQVASSISSLQASAQAAANAAAAAAAAAAAQSSASQTTSSEETSSTSHNDGSTSNDSDEDTLINSTQDPVENRLNLIVNNEVLELKEASSSTYAFLDDVSRALFTLNSNKLSLKLLDSKGVKISIPSEITSKSKFKASADFIFIALSNGVEKMGLIIHKASGVAFTTKGSDIKELLISVSPSSILITHENTLYTATKVKAINQEGVITELKLFVVDEFLFSL